MDRRTMLAGLGVGAIVSAMTGLELKAQTGEVSGGLVYELRTYHAAAGRLDELLARFRDDTMKLYARHGINSVAYWTPTDEPLKGTTLIYMLEHPSREKATANWQAFHDDPEWKKISAESDKNGKIVEKIESTFMVRTDFSPKI